MRGEIRWAIYVEHVDPGRGRDRHTLVLAQQRSRRLRVDDTMVYAVYRVLALGPAPTETRA